MDNKSVTVTGMTDRDLELTIQLAWPEHINALYYQVFNSVKNQTLLLASDHVSGFSMLPFSISSVNGASFIKGWLADANYHNEHGNLSGKTVKRGWMISTDIPEIRNPNVFIVVKTELALLGK